METIKLNTYSWPDKKSILQKKHYYELFLNDRRYYFSNKRAANSFLSECNEFLTLYYNQLNDLYAELFVYSRYFWMAEKTDIMRDITNIDFWFKRLSWRGANYNQFVFNYLNNIINELTACYQKLLTETQKSNSWTKKNELKAKIFQLDNLKEKTQSFPDLENIPNCFITF